MKYKDIKVKYYEGNSNFAMPVGYDETYIESLIKKSKENYDAILKETNSRTAAMLISGYDPKIQ